MTDSMTKQELDRLSALREAADDEYRGARRRLSDAEAALRIAKVAYAEANPHPWTGELVQRQKRHGYGRDTKTVKGTVTAYDPAKHRGLRGLWNINPGEPIVLSLTGKSAQNFALRDNLPGGETAWELVE